MANWKLCKHEFVMIDEFDVKARGNDQMADMANLASKLGSSDSAEND